MENLIRWADEAGRLLALAIVPAIAVIGVLTLRRSRSASSSVAALSAGLDVAVLLSLVLVAVVGLRPGLGLPGGWEQWNLVPFRDLARSLDGRPWGTQIAVANIAGNVAIFVPWGFLFALRFQRASWRTLLLLTAGMSVSIELWQAITATGRSSDVTDVITNTFGGLLGYGIGTMIVRRRSRLAASTAPAALSGSPTCARDRP